MWIYREQVSSLSQKSKQKILSNISLGDLPVKTFILAFNYNLVSHHREKKFTVDDIAMGYRDKLSLISSLMLQRKYS